MPGQKLNVNHEWTHHGDMVPMVFPAYEICLGVEEELMSQPASILAILESKALEKRLIDVRILGYPLIFAPGDAARAHIAKTIVTGQSEGSDALND